ncbi:hypothetical protein KC725_04770 [Candidatus Peregrinibacteria bacterium]|nr:hypothetical protein [Candidatus Peregrinibacteria bacterium]
MADQDKKTQESVKQAQKSPASSTQTFLKIAEIKNDTVVLKNGGLRGVLKVSSINFNLKSEDEQNAIIYSYQGFLNTLEYPIQIVIRSKKLDIDDYLEDLKKVGDNQTNQLLQQQTYEYIEYVSKLVEYADIMEKEFFVVVPYDPFRAQKLNIFQKFFQNMNPKDNYTEVKRRHEEFAELKKKLSSRINTVKVGLENCGLQVEELDTKALIELYYQSYNPTASRYQKLDELEETQIKNDTEIGRAA